MLPALLVPGMMYARAPKGVIGALLMLQVSECIAFAVRLMLVMHDMRVGMVDMWALKAVIGALLMLHVCWHKSMCIDT